MACNNGAIGNEILKRMISQCATLAPLRQQHADLRGPLQQLALTTCAPFLDRSSHTTSTTYYIFQLSESHEHNMSYYAYDIIIAMMVTSDQSCWLAEGYSYYNLRLEYCILPLLDHH